MAACLTCYKDGTANHDSNPLAHCAQAFLKVQTNLLDSIASLLYYQVKVETPVPYTINVTCRLFKQGTDLEAWSQLVPPWHGSLSRVVQGG